MRDVAEVAEGGGDGRLLHFGVQQFAVTGADGESVVIQDWQPGGFGIQLEDANPTPAASRIIVGDLQPVDPGRFDDLQNLVTTGGAALNRADTLNGSEGNDLIESGGGNDRVFAAGGDDVIEAGAGNDIVDGGIGNDIIAGGGDADILFGGAGDDEIYAGEKVDLFSVVDQTQSGGTGRELLVGGEGDDLVVGDITADVLLGGAGADFLLGGAGDDDLIGDKDASTLGLDWTVTRKVIAQGDGNEYRLEFTSGFAFVSEAAQFGADSLYGGAGDDWLLGGGGDDYLDGGSGDDVMFGQAGSDVLAGGAGNDVMSGDDPGNVPAAQEGDDWLAGEAGDDQLFANGGNDTLIGGTGNDFLSGGTGDDVFMFALGDGQDTITDASGVDTVIVNANFAGVEVLVDPQSPDFLGIFYSGSDSIAIRDGLKGTIESFEFNDGTYTLAEVLKKLHTNVTVTGTNATGNTLYGGMGDDTLSAAAGANTFQAGDGVNVINGGSGTDTYIFSRKVAQDTIRDAGGNADRIQLIDIAPEEVTVQRDTHSLRLLVPATLDALTLIDSYSNPTAHIESVEFDDGTVWSYSDLVTRAGIVESLGGVIVGTPGPDTLRGTADADWIYGLGGDDVLTGLAGRDTIDAGAGDDDITGGPEFVNRRWVEEALSNSVDTRDARWSAALAVGSGRFVETMQLELGIKAKNRDVSEAAGTYTLRESRMPYRPIFDGKNEPLRLKNTVFWERSLESTEA